MDLVLLFPGQGSQRPGMGRDLAEAHPAARQVFQQVDETLGVALSTLCFEGPAEELTLTHNAQPALFAHGAAVWAVTAPTLAPHVRAAAGHSLGEFTAYHAAGSLTLQQGARLVRRRGELMLRAGEDRPGTMAAILGELDRPIAELCADASALGVVVPANDNSPGQLVISGEVAAVERALELARAAGARRTVPLAVSGAFHSPLMEAAATELRRALADAQLTRSAFPVYSNVTAQAVSEEAVAVDLLYRQLTAPVCWTDEVRALAAAHPDALFVEMGPGSVLTGLMKRIAPTVATATCGTAAEVDALLARAL